MPGLTMEQFAKLVQDTMPEAWRDIEVWEITFKGAPFLFIGKKGVDGAIATTEQFDNFLESHAHLNPTGHVCRYHSNIGTKNDIEWIRKVDR